MTRIPRYRCLAPLALPPQATRPILPNLRFFNLQPLSPISARNWASRSTRFTDGGRELRQTCSLAIRRLHFGDVPSPLWVCNPSRREGLRQQQSGKFARLLPKTRRSGALVPGILVRGGNATPRETFVAPPSRSGYNRRSLSLARVSRIPKVKDDVRWVPNLPKCRSV